MSFWKPPYFTLLNPTFEQITWLGALCIKKKTTNICDTNNNVWCAYVEKKSMHKCYLHTERCNHWLYRLKSGNGFMENSIEISHTVIFISTVYLHLERKKKSKVCANSMLMQRHRKETKYWAWYAKRKCVQLEIKLKYILTDRLLNK